MSPANAQPTTLTLIPWGICLLYMVLACGALYLAFSRLRIVWARVQPTLGDTLLVRVFSLVLASLIAPTVLPESVVRIVRAVLWFIIQKPLDVASSLTEFPGTSGMDIAIRTVKELAFALLMAVKPDTNSVPVKELVYILLCWVLLGQLLSRPTSDVKHTRLQLLVAQVGVTRVKNGVTLLMLGLGLYLSIASILAVTTVGQPVASNEAVSPDKLRANLKELQLTQAELEAMFPFSSTDPFLSLRDSIKLQETRFASLTVSSAEGASKTIPAGGPPRPNDYQRNTAKDRGLLQEAKTGLQFIDSNLEQLQSQWKAAVRTAQEVQTFEFNRAIHTFVTDGAGSKSERETIEHFSELADWYNSLISQNRETLNHCFNHIQDTKLKLALYSLRWQHALGSLQYDLNSNISMALPDLDLSKESCALGPTGAPPKRKHTGQFLGTLEPYFQWLIALESMPLALIVGMLGFGLLGSLISTSVREKAHNGSAPSGGLIVADLSGALIRGISATVVIYLSVAGGLAVFTRSANEPNPHLLLFVCLVAAVFSEDVWEWAHARFKDGLNRNKLTPTEDGDGGKGGDTSGEAKETAAASSNTGGETSSSTSGQDADSQATAIEPGSSLGGAQAPAASATAGSSQGESDSGPVADKTETKDVKPA